MIHTPDPQLFERSIHILVVGCGGNGSAIAAGLPYLHQALLAFGHPGGLKVTLIDPDTVSETNCIRQPFCRTEIGLSKAVVLAHRTNMFWGLNWQGMQAKIEHLKGGAQVDILIGCVDTRKARRAIKRWVLRSRVLYWLDLGNNAATGQFVLGQPKNAANRKKKDRLPTVAELYPEIVSRKGRDDDQPSCSAAEALTRQEPFINQSLGYSALAMLTLLLRRGSVSYQGGFCNPAKGQLVPLPIRSIPDKCRRCQRGRKPLAIQSRRVNFNWLGMLKAQEISIALLTELFRERTSQGSTNANSTFGPEERLEPLLAKHRAW